MARSIPILYLLFLGLLAPSPLLGATQIIASSEHVDSTGNGGKALAFDGDLATAWVEGAPGFGRGEWVGLKLDSTKQIDTVTVFPGCFASSQCFEEQAHGEVIFIEWEGPGLDAPARLEVPLPDAFQAVSVKVDAKVRTLKVGFSDLYDGARFSDGYIAEVAINLPSPDAALVAAMEANRGKGRAKASFDAWTAEVEGAIAKVGDPTQLEGALPLLMDAARLGNPVDRAYITKRVPPGFRLAYTPPNLQAIDALGQSRALTALPAIEQAAARSTDPATAPRIQHLAKWFKAYEDFSRKTQESIPYWGGRGTVQGLMMSMGEPLSIDVDPSGRVFVADVGNNRVQRFTTEGRVDRATGSGRGIDEVYFGKKVDPFVVGAARGSALGQFENPLFVEVIEGEEGSLLAVVDAGLRVQILTLDLQPLAQWTLPASGEVLNGIGLRWPLLAQGRSGEVTVFAGKKGYIYNLKGELIKAFDLEGEPRAVATIKKRYLLVFGGEEVVSYTLDGQRDRVFFSLPSEDRSEDIDITSDGIGHVVVHSDNAVAYQLDKRGRLLGAQKTFKKPTYPCRIALHEGVLFVTHSDSIHRYELVAPE